MPASAQVTEQMGQLPRLRPAPAEAAEVVALDQQIGLARPSHSIDRRRPDAKWHTRCAPKPLEQRVHGSRSRSSVQPDMRVRYLDDSGGRYSLHGFIGPACSVVSRRSRTTLEASIALISDGSKTHATPFVFTEPV